MLAGPFRSPLFAQTSKPPEVISPPPSPQVTPQKRKSEDLISDPPKPVVDTKLVHRTKRVAKQFQSPLVAGDPTERQSAVRLTPMIQILERKLQLLRRAVKVKEEGEEKTLMDVGKKWREAGREVAWEVWELVKDNGGGGSETRGSEKRSFQGSWGWSEQGQEKKRRTENWGWEEEKDGETDEVPFLKPHDEVEEDRPQATLGTMLRQFGIAPEVLGWSEEDAEFRDIF